MPEQKLDVSASEFPVEYTTEALLTSLDHLQEYPKPLQPADCALLRKAFSSHSAHVRSKAIDVLALRSGPKLWLGAAAVGELVLWHTQDTDARVRDRAFHCLLAWITTFRPGTAQAEIHVTLKAERTSWILSSLEATYSAACYGLMDVEEMVRRTSLHFLAQLSLTKPHHRLEDVPPSSFLSNSGSKQRSPAHTDEEVRLVDDAFRRVCLRLQDPARQVRQLAAQILADLARAVSESSLILTLEKTVMADRQVRRAVSERSVSNSQQPNRGSSERRSPSRSSTFWTNSNVFNLVATGSSGAIITGLEDDYFEVRCATLVTVTHIASLSAQFAANCQDLLVDMLTDDIQEVRFAAIRALGAVGDQVPLQSEQVAIITSALAEGSDRMRRRLHQLLSRCRLSSAPCLISLLDGLLHNLRRYPQDRDSLWRCAASVGRRHSVFVETCLSSLLRTHLWLSGPEPNWEDPAYLTVILLVLNAEPGAPGMQAQFPRHLAATKVYLTELVPSLVPKRSKPFDPICVTDPTDPSVHSVSKRRRLDWKNADSGPATDSDSCQKDDSANSDSLLRFMHSLICRVVGTLNDLSCPFVCPASGETNRSVLVRPSPGFWNQRLSLLTRLLFADLCGSAQRLDRCGRWNGLIQWLILLTTLGWCLACVGAYAMQSTYPTITTRPIMRKPGRLLLRALQLTLRGLHLFIGKTATEESILVNLVNQILSLTKSTEIEGEIKSMPLWADTIQSTAKLMIELISASTDCRDPIEFSHSNEVRSIGMLQKSAKRLHPVYVALLQPFVAHDTAVGSTDPDLFGFSNILPAGGFTNPLNEDADDGWTPASHISDQLSTSIPEVRFTATIGAASIRVRAIVAGMNLSMVRKRVCVLFRRPDIPVEGSQMVTKSTSHELANLRALWTTLFHQWWPPAGAWHPLDEDRSMTSGTQSQQDVDRVELRTHLQLSAGRWSDVGTVEIGLGYCLPSSSTDWASTSNLDSTNRIDFAHTDDSMPSFVIPLTPHKMLARVKLMPSAPISQW